MHRGRELLVVCERAVAGPIVCGGEGAAGRQVEQQPAQFVRRAEVLDVRTKSSSWPP